MSDSRPTNSSPADPRNPRVFISYSTEDKVVADEVCAGLESSGVPCWIAPRDVRPGQNWGGSIVKSIAAAKVMVLVFSRHTNSSRHVMNEIERAVSHGVTIIPFRIEVVRPSEDLELFISSCHWLDAFTPPLSARVADLVVAVGAALGGEASPAAPARAVTAVDPPSAPPKPSRGLLIGAVAAGVVALSAAAFFFVWRPALLVEPSPDPPRVEAAPVAAGAASEKVSAEDLLARAKTSEDEEDFVGALEAYGELLSRDPTQPPVRLRTDNLIARLMEQTEGRPQDPRLVAAVRGVAEANVASAQNFSGILLRDTNPQESLAMFKKAAGQGVGRAMAEAGLMISNGDGAPADMAEAAQWLKRSADAGFPEGMLLYAECLLTGKGIPVDERAAAELYSKAAALGSAAAKSHLARMYQHGVGVPAADPRKAFGLFEAAAAQGFVEAQGRLGALYMSGEAGPKNPQKAVQLWQDGAAKGDIVCMLFFAISLESGAIGAPNKPEATFWYQKAAKAGNPDAQNWCVQNRIDF